MIALVLALAAAAAAVPVLPQTQCPPPGFNSLQGFNVTAYVGAPWYIQKQMVVRYLPENQFYCVRAQYSQKSDDKIRVENYANVDAVNGPATGGELEASIKDLNDPSKLLVGPTFIPDLFRGDYWVLAVGATYDWALVSGGPPTIDAGEAGCRTGTGTNGSGLWILSRTQVAPADQVAMVEDLAKQFGFDTSVLLPVEQAGCQYQ